MATSTVTRIERGFSHPYRRPFAFAWLACGHSHESAEVGAVVECEPCDRQAANVAKLRDGIAAGIISHSRASRFGGGDVPTIDVYQYDAKSPTGVIHYVSVEDRPEVAAILCGPLSPLSPTEAR